MELDAPAGWDLSLVTTPDGAPVVVADLRLASPSRLRLRVQGVEIAGEAPDAVVRMPPYARIAVDVDATDLEDPIAIADSLRALRGRLRTGIRAVPTRSAR